MTFLFNTQRQNSIIYKSGKLRLVNSFSLMDIIIFFLSSVIFKKTKEGGVQWGIKPSEITTYHLKISNKPMSPFQ